MSARDIRDKLYRQLIPALPVPFTLERIIHQDSNVRMAEYMQSMQIGGVAVWAHTGRGLLLTKDERAEVLTHWRESLPNAVIVAGAGSREMAEHAKLLGADAILCHPPTGLRNMPETVRDEAIIEYHHELSQVGLPLILFYLYEAAGGIRYSSDVLRKIFALPNVIGIKIATLDSVMTFQNLTRSIKSEFPDKLLITGEDRFLGYSLMMGADAALVGMGTALAGLQANTMSAYYEQEFDKFHYLSNLVDQFSMATFCDPMESYIGRMLYSLAALGVISRDAIFDPWGPALAENDIDQIETFLTSLPAELKN
jgi:4-hydroxy-tetrahydrodipicolinate synthase